MNDKKIVIHIGPPKTGTSALQFCFHRNTDYLSRNGVWYPQHPVGPNRVSSGNRDFILSPLPDPLDGPPTLNWSVDNKKIKKLCADFEKSKYTTLLLSSEFFWRQAMDLYKYFPNARYIAYLRNPIDLLESNYNQGVKRAGSTSPFSVRRPAIFRQLSVLSEIFEHKNKIRLELRPYGAEFFVGGSIEADFYSLLGLEYEQPDLGMINSSYSFEALEFKRHANHFELGALDAKLDNLLQGCDLGKSSYSLIPPARYRKLLDRYLRRLDRFIDNYSQSNLIAYRNGIESIQQRDFCQQKIDKISIQMISDYLRLNAPSEYRSLQTIVRNNRDILLPNNQFFECFDKKPPSRLIHAARKIAGR